MEFNPKISESLTLKFAQAAAERKKRGEKIISLGLGEPDFNTPKEIVDATVKVLKSKQSKYSAPLGVQILRDKIAEKLHLENNIKATSENIIVTPGAKQALQIILMALLEPNDEVVMIMPAYVSYVPQVLISEPTAKIKYVDLNKEDHSLDIELLSEIVSDKTKAIIINTPQNPAGAVLKKDELEKLFILAKRNNSFIISDEVYEKLVFNGASHFSIGAFEEVPDRVITINGFSKSHAMTGWRLGYACFPEELKTKVLKIQQHINTNTCTFIQEALGEVLPIDSSYLVRYNEILEKRVQLYKEFLDRVSKINGVLPNGSFFAFLNISELNIDSNTFASQLIDKTGVAVTPGIAFGENWDDHIRISLAVDNRTLEEAFYLIEDFISKL
ncbi:pyridoxal phosphate-dependent aminotransferase [Bacteroidota bacterium]